MPAPDAINNLVSLFSEHIAPQDKPVVDGRIAATDREIDQLVYDLYGLTEEEIAIVEERHDETRHGLSPPDTPHIGEERAWACSTELDIDGYSEEQVGHHVFLMGDAGLLRVADATHQGSASPVAIPITILWEGHEFLNAIRSDTIWSRTKRKFADTGVSMTFEAAKAVALRYASDALGLT